MFAQLCSRIAFLMRWPRNLGWSVVWVERILMRTHANHHSVATNAFSRSFIFFCVAWIGLTAVCAHCVHIWQLYWLGYVHEVDCFEYQMFARRYVVTYDCWGSVQCHASTSKCHAIVVNVTAVRCCNIALNQWNYQSSIEQIFVIFFHIEYWHLH